MILPPVTSLSVLDSTGRPVEALVFSMRVITGQRNPYNILFPKTDVDGIAKLKAEDIQGQFEDCHSEDLMGHFGTLSDASQEVVFSLLDATVLRGSLPQATLWPLMPYEAKKWQSRQAKVQYLLSARNCSYERHEVPLNLPVHGSVQLQVKLRDGA